ncbi:poly(ADP-ribose) glycohydrolase [Plakobranchus ocellatus]|uniref:poly(ADP-ribose) glycohydrolase n=1 Tax=Plakobranchus ocellatus TaxID=259542 RepID=A0AAV3ZX36_9GAST|nr:poly(ADP-ribose) glycohydrolase [Plakobranchus ocellatus]
MAEAGEIQSQQTKDEMESMEAKTFVLLPSDLQCWPVVKEFLLELQGRLINENISAQEMSWYMQVVYNTIQNENCGPVLRRASASLSCKSGGGSAPSDAHKMRAQLQASVRKRPGINCVWYGMLKYLKEIPKDEADAFLFNTLPRILEMALGIEECQPKEGLALSEQQIGGTTELSRQFVSSVVACLFLCLFPERKRDKASRLNVVNFTKFFKHLPIPSQVAKLQCVLCYFENVIKRGMEINGNITLSRKSAGSDWLLGFDELLQCDLQLCPVSLHHTGVIEDSGPEALHVDFANRSIGGGVLGRGRVQEEIRFSTCPELLVALLFMESLQANEAIFISGFEQFSSYSGYADSLSFAGPYRGQGQLHSLVAIDAVSYKSKPLICQYEEASVLRDLNKALVGFSCIGVHVTPAPLLSIVEDASVTQDVAADMVTSVLTEAVSEAADTQEEESRYLEWQRSIQDPEFEAFVPLRQLEQQHEESQTIVKLEPESRDSERGPLEVLCVEQQVFAEQRAHHPHITPEISPLSSSQAIFSIIPAPYDPAYSAKPVLDPPQPMPLSPSPAAQLSQVNVPCVSSCNVDFVSPIHPMTKDPHQDIRASHLLPSTPDCFSTLAMTLPAEDSTSASVHPPHSLPSLVLQTDQGELSEIFFESDSLGNLSRVLVNRTVESASHVSPAAETDSQNLEILSSDDVAAGSNVPLLSLDNSITESTTTPLPSRRGITSHPIHSNNESNIPHTTAEKLKTKVSSCLSPESPLSSLAISSICHAEQADLSLPSASISHQSLEISPPLPASGMEESLSSAQPTLPVAFSLADSSEDLFQLRSPSSSNVGDSCEDVSSYSNTPRSLDITIPVPNPSLTGTSLERAGSALSNLSMVVNVDSPTPSCASIEDDLGRMLYVSVDNEGECEGGTGAGSGRLGSHIFPRHNRRLPSSTMSPRSKLAMQKQQASASSLGSVPVPQASSCVHSNPPFQARLTSGHPIPADTSSTSNTTSATDGRVIFDSQQIYSTSTITTLTTTTSTTISPTTSPAVEPSQSTSLTRKNSRDLYVELKEFLSSSSCSSRDSAGSWSGIHPPLSSSSSFGSRSGSLSSHRGSNGFTGDFLEFWNHYRRRSSQMSQLSDSSSSFTTSSSASMSGASRRSSSSHKHSIDFNTDLEDISESLLKHSHGVIEEEGGGVVGMVTDFATHSASAAFQSGVTTAISKASDEAPLADPEDISLTVPPAGDRRSTDITEGVEKEPCTKLTQSKSHVKSAIPVPSPSGRGQSSLSSRDPVDTPVVEGSENKVSVVSEPSPGPSHVSAPSKAMSGTAALTRRALLGKAYPRTSTLKRQQEVSIHPEDEEQEVMESTAYEPPAETRGQSLTAEKSSPMTPLHIDIVADEETEQFSAKMRKKHPVDSCFLGSSQKIHLHQSPAEERFQDDPKRSQSKPCVPATSHTPACPSADSGYISLLSTAGRTGCESAFQFSPSSTSFISPRQLESQPHPHHVDEASLSEESGAKEKSHEEKHSSLQGEREQAQGAGATFSVKTLQSGEQKLFATLETKTIYLAEPPPHSPPPSGAKAATETGKMDAAESSHSGTDSLAEASARLKKKETSSKQTSSGSRQKVKSQISSIPRKRTSSDPSGGVKAASRNSSKWTRRDSQTKKTESKHVKEDTKPRRLDRAVSEPCDVSDRATSRTAERSVQSESQPRKVESKSSKELKTKTTVGKPERLPAERRARGKSSKMVLSPGAQEQPVSRTGRRRSSNTSADGADGSVSDGFSLSPSPSSGASGPVKSSSIPKYKDSGKKSSPLTSFQGKSPLYPSKLPKSDTRLLVVGRLEKEKKRHHHQSKASSKLPVERQVRQEPFFHIHKSRYVFSDVAAPLKDKKSRKVAEDSSRKKSDGHHHHSQHHYHHSLSSKKPQEEHRKTSKTEQRVKKKKPAKLSSKIFRFVSSIGERALSEAVLEGADIVAQRSLIASLTGEQTREISDEVYSWFSNKIINQVFSHILHDLESRDRQQLTAGSPLLGSRNLPTSQQLREIGASSGSPGEELGGRMFPSPVDASATDSLSRSLSPSILSRSPMSQATRAASPSSTGVKSPLASGGAGGDGSAESSHKRQGSVKMVKFQVGPGRRGSDADAAETVPMPPTDSQSHLAASPVSPSSTSSLHILSSPASLFPVISSTSIPIPTRRRSSFDLASLSPPSSAMKAMGFSPPLRPIPLPASPLFIPSTPERPGGDAAVTDSAAKMLGSIDLSLDIYQVAASIVDQVFQNISDSVKDPHSDLSAHCVDGDFQRERPGCEGFVTNIFSSSSAASRSSSAKTKTTSGTASTKARGNNHSAHHQTRRSMSPSLGLFSRQPMSRQVLTSAFLRVEGGGGWGPTLRTYQRRSSEPGQTSVQLTLQALNSIKFSSQAADEQARQRKVSRTDDDIGRHSSGRTWRRGSLDGGFTSSSSSSFEGRRRSSCGFKDPVLSRFAEELMKADTSVPELVIVGSHPSSTSTGSRRSSFSGFRDTTLAYLESELLNTSFTSVNSLPLSASTSPRASQRRHRRRHRHATTTTTATASTSDSHYRQPDLDRSHSRESAHSQMSGGAAQWKSDSSDAEYWFPPPRLVGEEFRLEYERQHSQEELEDCATFFAGQVVQEAVCVLRQDPDFQQLAAVKKPEDRDVDIFAENLTDQILRDVYFSTANAAGVDHSDEAAVTTVGSHDVSHGGGKQSQRKDELSKHYGKGARPKVWIPSQAGKLSAESPAYDLPPRKHVRSRHSEEVHIVPDLPLDYDSGRKKNRARLKGDAKERRQLLTPPASASLGSSSTRPSSSQVQTPNVQLPPVMSSLPVPIKGSHLQQSPQPRLKVRIPTRTIPSPAQATPHSKELKFQARAADVGDVSTCSSSDTCDESDNTSSSLLSLTSSEEDIGPQGLLHLDEREGLRGQGRRYPQVVAARSSAGSDSERKSSHSGNLSRGKESAVSMDEKLTLRESPIRPKKQAGSSLPKRKTRQVRLSKKDRENLYGHSRSRASQGRELVSGSKEEHSWPAIDQFASDLIQRVFTEAMEECRQARWKRFVSYQRPIATGNWGCGAFRGDVQLKFFLQWLAASVARCPNFVYYTFGETALVQAEDLVKLCSGRNVGELARLLRSYCHTVCLHLSPASSSSSSSSSSTRCSSFTLTEATPVIPGQSPSTPSALKPKRAASFESSEQNLQQQQQRSRRFESKRPRPESKPSLAGQQSKGQGQLPITLFEFLQEQLQKG